MKNKSLFNKNKKRLTEFLIDNYPVGSDITVLDCSYVYADWKNGKEDFINIVYIDNKTGQKGHQTIHNPVYTFRHLSEKASQKAIDGLRTNEFYKNKSDYDLHYCYYGELIKEICFATGQKDRYYELRKLGKDGNTELRLATIGNPKVEDCDQDIRDFYRAHFAKQYKNQIPQSISKMFLDIEVDITKLKKDFPEDGECPVNVITITIPDKNKTVALLLRNSENPQIARLEERVKTVKGKKEFTEEIREMIKESLTNESKYEEYNLDKVTFELVFFDKEIELIKSAFMIINKYTPDFVFIWNMAFDINYIIARIRNISPIRPEDIISHPNYLENERFCTYKKINGAKEANKRGDYFNISSYSVFGCQMIHFASRNASNMKKFGNWRLDNIGEIVANFKKLDMGGLTHSNFSIKNYPKFVAYAIIDTLVQSCIEKVSRDIDFIFNKSLQNSTRYDKIHRQSVYEINAIRRMLDEEGTFLCNNKANIIFSDDTSGEDDKFPGAFVADPTLISDKMKVEVNGVPISLFRDNNDFDYSALYPSLAMQFNIGHEAMIGKMEFVEDTKTKYKYDNSFYNHGAYFNELLSSNDYVTIAQQFLDLPSVTEMRNKVATKLKEKAMVG